MADKLAKSFEEKENLIELNKVVEEIGREGVEEVIKALPEESQALFKDSLEKAMSLDAAAQEKHGAKIKQVESEDAREDDEEAAKKRRDADKGGNLETKGGDTVKHQGDDSELKGQVIKSEEDSTEEMVEKGAVKELAIDELEKGELLEKMIEKMRKRGMDHDKVMDALSKKGYDVEMAKGKWADMNEMDQMSKENREEASKLEKKDDKKMKKSIIWDSPNKRIEANARNGQNTHIEVQDYLVNEALNKAEGEPLKKSEEDSKDFDPSNINDVIEKGYDPSKTAREITNEMGLLRVWDCGKRTWSKKL